MLPQFTYLLSTAPAMPDVSPDFSGPGSSALLQIASWFLGICLIITFFALVASVISLATKGFGNQNIQQFTAKAFVYVLLAVAVLGSIGTIFQFAVGFDLGI